MMRSKNTAGLLMALPLAALLAVSGCGSAPFAEDKKVDYKSAGKLPPLEVPPDLTAPGSDDHFAVPDITPQASATYSAYSKERASPAAAPAAGVTAAATAEKMRIERAGAQRWLVVRDTPENLWPAVKQFWQESGFLIQTEMPEVGIMETDWAENRAKIPQGGIRNLLGKVLDGLYSTSERDKFRSRFERGAAGVTEIYISHRGMAEIYTSEGKDRTMWQPRPSDPELEAEMLGRLMVRLGAQETRAQALLAVAPEERATLVKAANGEASLTLNDAFDRAWRRVGLVLDRIGFAVEDRDRSKGIYYVRYADPEAGKESKGLLAGLAFWRDDKAAKDKGPQQYRIAVAGTEAGSRVSVFTRDGAPEQSETAVRILTLLYEQLK